ncbi:MAG TPA: triose-phosphate isomerase, partial [Iamia sp.]
MARTPLISGNWKMHHNHFEALATVQKLNYLLGEDADLPVDVSVHAPFTDLRTLQTAMEQDKMSIALGAQHCHWEEKGAFTGEVSPAMLAKLNVRYVIAGHSERREIFGETDEWVNKKVLAILAHGMVPIMCCGETLDEREAGETEAKVSGQVRAGLEGVSPAQVGALVIAYEPIWAIGTGRTASAEDAQETCQVVRATVAEVAGADAAAAVRIQ